MTLNEFCNSFNIVDNALSMRDLLRWNGRAVRNKENLSEHTHLVCACAISLMNILPKGMFTEKNKLNIFKICMFHDSLELFRGDILSTTKEDLPAIKQVVDSEEKMFINGMVPDANDFEFEVSRLADLMACYKYIEHEIKTPSNEYMLNAYIDTKNKFECAYKSFLLKNKVIENLEYEVESDKRLSKAHKDDCGTDVILKSDVIILPHKTTVVDLELSVNVEKGKMAYLCSRTSAASKGLIVASCPIDTGYKGTIHAIVHNVSNNVVYYSKGQSFCQIIYVPCESFESYEIRESTERIDGNRGSTGLC